MTWREDFESIKNSQEHYESNLDYDNARISNDLRTMVTVDAVPSASSPRRWPAASSAPPLRRCSD